MEEYIRKTKIKIKFKLFIQIVMNHKNIDVWKIAYSIFNTIRRIVNEWSVFELMAYTRGSKLRRIKQKRTAFIVLVSNTLHVNHMRSVSYVA